MDRVKCPLKAVGFLIQNIFLLLRPCYVQRMVTSDIYDGRVTFNNKVFFYYVFILSNLLQFSFKL